MKTLLDAYYSISVISLWLEAIVSGVLLPIFFECGRRGLNYLKQQRPLEALLGGYLSEKHTVLIFLPQLKAAHIDNAGRCQITSDPKYVILYPMPTPTDRNSLNIEGRQNIDPVWACGDGECLADIYNVLGKAGKIKNVGVADLIKDWGKLSDPTFTIGFSPKTIQLLELCNPIFFEVCKDELRIKGVDKGFSSNFPNDPAVLQKTYFANSKIPVFILAGLGVTGTSCAGYYLRQHCVDLGKMYGNSPFCAFLNTNVTNTKTAVELKTLYPRPSPLRILLHLILYFRLTKKGVFTN